MQGRGCWKKRTFVAAASGICSGERRQLVSDIESAYDTAPLSQIARLCGNPVQAGLVSGAQMLKILRWLMERSLTAWVEEQNAVHGVAPSRAQLVEQALCAIPALAPQFYQQKLRSLLLTTPRSQRRWLATFRLRWGCASESSSCAATYQCKRSNPRSIWGKPVFGCVWESQNWERTQEIIAFPNLIQLQTHFWECLALPFLAVYFLPGFGLFPMDQRSLRSRSCPSPAFADQHGRDCRGAACQWVGWYCSQDFGPDRCIRRSILSQ